MKYQFILSHRHEFSVKRMCYMLNVCSSGFYAWLKRGESRRQREDAKLLRRIQEIFARSGPELWQSTCLGGIMLDGMAGQPQACGALDAA